MPFSFLVPESTFVSCKLKDRSDVLFTLTLMLVIPGVGDVLH